MFLYGHEYIIHIFIYVCIHLYACISNNSLKDVHYLYSLNNSKFRRDFDMNITLDEEEDEMDQEDNHAIDGVSDDNYGEVYINIYVYIYPYLYTFMYVHIYI
jgi:hypothetical protein